MEMVVGLVGDGSIATTRCCGGDEPALGLGAHTREEGGGGCGARHVVEEKRGGVRLASEAHVGVEPEATAWSATSTRMRRS
jgi:hypothetical protein